MEQLRPASADAGDAELGKRRIERRAGCKFSGQCGRPVYRKAGRLTPPPPLSRSGS